MQNMVHGMMQSVNTITMLDVESKVGVVMLPPPSSWMRYTHTHKLFFVGQRPVWGGLFKFYPKRSWYWEVLFCLLECHLHEEIKDSRSPQPNAAVCFYFWGSMLITLLHIAFLLYRSGFLASLNDLESVLSYPRNLLRSSIGMNRTWKMCSVYMNATK
jgi:hypothetical protein